MTEKKHFDLFEHENFSGYSFCIKFFFQNYRYFDIKTKSNGTLNRTNYLPNNFKYQTTLPLILDYGNLNFKLRTVLQCLNIIKFFTYQKSFLKKKLILQQLKKKNSGFVLQSKVSRSYSFIRFYYFILTIIPYMKVSYGIDWCVILSNLQGNMSFGLDDIAFFSHYLNEKHLEWDKKFYFSFQWVYKKNFSNLKSNFFFLPFIKSMLNRLFWSSLSLKCFRGHGGWLTFSKFPLVVFNSNSKFFSKNFKF